MAGRCAYCHFYAPIRLWLSRCALLIVHHPALRQLGAFLRFVGWGMFVELVLHHRAQLRSMDFGRMRHIDACIHKFGDIRCIYDLVVFDRSFLSAKVLAHSIEIADGLASRLAPVLPVSTTVGS